MDPSLGISKHKGPISQALFRVANVANVANPTWPTALYPIRNWIYVLHRCQERSCLFNAPVGDTSISIKFDSTSTVLHTDRTCPFVPLARATKDISGRTFAGQWVPYGILVRCLGATPAFQMATNQEITGSHTWVLAGSTWRHPGL